MNLLSQISPEPLDIVRSLAHHGYEAYIVGGAVRDLLLGAVPKDYDITTSATPEEIRAVFGRRSSRIIGRRFRLVHVYAGGSHTIYEVSTFRRQPDSNERRGKKSDDGKMIWNDNVYGTLEDDASRRDFTVNALYLDVMGDGQILDFSHGQDDLKRKIVRVIGDPAERFAEDPVRMLRALKLVGQYGFRLDKPLEKALRANLEKLTLASPARLFEELLKIVGGGHPILPILETFHHYGLLKYFWPVYDQAWEEGEGDFSRRLLKTYDMYMQTSDSPPSKALCLSVLVLPFLMSAHNPQNMFKLWKPSVEGARLCQRVIDVLFENYNVPRLFSARTADICNLVPKMMLRPLPKSVTGHIEYRYGKLLTEILFDTCHWDRSALDKLPPAPPRRSYRK
jgi:poly(A) polymerase